MLAKGSERRIPSGHQSHIHPHPHAGAERPESFHGAPKQEYIWPHGFANYQEAEAVTSEAFMYYQTMLHPAKYVPPDEFAAPWEA